MVTSRVVMVTVIISTDCVSEVTVIEVTSKLSHTVIILTDFFVCLFQTDMVIDVVSAT